MNAYFMICLQCGMAYKRRPSVVGKYCSRECSGLARREPRTTVTERFWRYVDKTPGCWLWTGYRDRGGYGTIQVAHYPKLVHRMSYEMQNGVIPDKKVVRHTCDVRHCVNPAHLVIGTAADNTADMLERGRAAYAGKNAAHLYPERRPRGERHGNAKLSD